jgi:UDP-GlcNAc:undecaprenyl-phosphate GlcNAc-1-phosphate transferase
VIRVGVAFLVAAVLSHLLTPLLRRAALRLHILDWPDGRLKTHAAPVPYLGGVAIYLAFLLTLLVTVELCRDVLAILLAGSLVALLGLVDDLVSLPPAAKLAGQVLAVAVLLRASVAMEAPLLPAWLSVALSCLWLLGMANAFNLIDVMDGLAAGVALVASLVLAGIALGNGRVIAASMLAALAGSLAGFLRYNVEPARIYMGDAGSLFLGLVLGALALNNGYTERNAVASLAPVVILGLPLLDMLFVVYVRWRRGAPILQGSPDHVPLRIRRWRLTVRQTVWASYLAAAALGAAGVTLTLVDGPAALVVLTATLAAVVALAMSLHKLDPTETAER